VSQSESHRSEIEVRDPCAVAFLVMLHSKPKGTSVNSKDVMEFYKIGKTRFHTAKNILLNLNLITEKKSGQYGFLEYQLLPIDENGQPSENDHPLKLARTVQCLHNVLKPTVNSKLNVNQHNANNLTLTKKKGSKDEFSRQGLYPENFLRIWNLFSPTLGAKGAKSEAFKAFSALKMSDTDVSWLAGRIKLETDRKSTVRKAKEFDPNFPHVCRILKRRDWEGWQEPVSTVEVIL
jgi:hypothetical protein